jgi:spore coat protein H
MFRTMLSSVEIQMKFRFVLTIVALLLGAGSAWAQQKDATRDFFGLTTFHTIRVSVSAADYGKMEPAAPARGAFGGGRAGGGGNRPPLGSNDFGAGNFEFEFTYVPAKLEIDGEVFDKVGLRYKGSGTYMMSARQVKRSLKIDFDRYVAKLSFEKIKKLNLNSGVMDPTKAREALAYAVFRAAGVPAPKTAFAEVTLTVPGKFDGEKLGVFTVVEQVDKGFLKEHFESGNGLLLKPEGIRGLPHFGTDPKAYEATYVPKDEADEGQWKRLIELTRLVNIADEAEFREQIGEFFDTDAFARFLAVNTALSSMDGFMGLGHNYYLYLVPKTNKFVFIPWDLDLAFAAFPMYGTAAQLTDLSIDHPHVGKNKLIDRLLAMPEFKAEYRKQLKRLSDEVFAAQLGKDLVAVEEALKGSLAKDKAAAEARNERPGGGPMFGRESVSLTSFIEKRKRSMDDQLAGKSKGLVPTQGFGGGGGFGPPGGGQIARPLFGALDADRDGKVTEEELATGMKKFSREWDRDNSGTLEEHELIDGLRKLPPRR